MKLSLLSLVSLAPALLPSCCNTEAYEAELQTWINRDEVSLLSKWGAPTYTYTIDSATKLLVFDKTYTRFVQGRPPSIFIDEHEYKKEHHNKKKHKEVIFDPGSPDHIESSNCKTSFTIKNKKVISWTWEGDACCG